MLSDKPLFFAINSYTEGLSPAVMEYVLKTTLCPKVGGHTSCDEIGLPRNRHRRCSALRRYRSVGRMRVRS